MNADSEGAALAALVTTLRRQHAERSEAEGIMRSRLAIQSWGDRVPAALSSCTRDELVAANRDRWLRDAECTVRTLDPSAFTGGTFHVIDGRDLGMPTTGYMGMAVAAHLHELAREYLPRSARNPVAAVAVNVEAVARCTVGSVCVNREHAIKQVRAAIAAIAAHEYAHHVVSVVEGETIPATASIEGTVNLLRTKGTDKPSNSQAHGAAWCRAYAHLLRRASFLPCRDVWEGRFRDDMRIAAPVDPDAVLDALGTECDQFTAHDALADVIRTPAPKTFLTLFDNRDAARSATEVVIHGGAT